ANSPVQMRAGDASRRAGKPDLLPLLDHVADGHVDSRQVQIGSVKPEAVVDVDGVAAEKQLLREHDPAAIGRQDRRTGRSSQVGARMRRPRLAVEYPSMTEVAAVLGARHRNLERLRPEALGREGVVNRACLRRLAVGPRLVLGAELDVTLLDLELR